MQEDSVCGGLLPSVSDNQYDFFQQDDLSGFNNIEQSHYPYLAQDHTEQSHYLAQGPALIPSIFQGNSSLFDMENEMKGWDNNVWG